jgi:hypothetical protein
MIYFLSSCVSLNFFKFALAKYTTLFPRRKAFAHIWGGFALHGEQSTRLFALFHAKSFKKQLETLLLRWYNKTVILWENRRMPSADRPRAWGILWGV